MPGTPQGERGWRPPPAPPGRADLSRGTLDLHSFGFSTDAGRDQRESGPSLLNPGLVDRNQAGGGGRHASEGPRPRKGGPWVPRLLSGPGTEAGSPERGGDQ